MDHLISQLHENIPIFVVNSNSNSKNYSSSYLVI